ncbi:MAG TPA: Tn3 family transposase [Alphaproteobacteria bacterium]|nr:Tn3 family transposase [Alphaproteobacteria bacterium]
MTEFKLSDDEILEITSKREKSNQVAFGVLYKYFQKYKKFPIQNDPDVEKISKIIIKQLPLAVNTEINWKSSSIEKNKSTIRKLFGYTIITNIQKQELTTYLSTFIFPKCLSFENVEEVCSKYFDEHRIASLSPAQQTRFLKSATINFEKQFFKQFSECLTDVTKLKIDIFLKGQNDDLSLSNMKARNPYLTRQSIKNETTLLRHLESFEFPKTIKGTFDDKLLMKYHDRVVSQSPSHLLRYNADQKYALMGSFLSYKRFLCLDNLATLLTKLIQRLHLKAEKHVKTYVMREVKRVNGKFDTLFTLADTALTHPKSKIEKKIYEAVPEQKLKEIVADLKYKGTWFKNQVNAKSLSLYNHGNRKMIWDILKVLTLKADLDDERCQKLLNAYEWIQEETSVSEVLYTDIFSPEWISFLDIKSENGITTFNKNAYECALFEQLAVALSVKNVWIEESLRYRNPKEDMPQDFKENITSYLSLLGLPKDADTFIEDLKKDLLKSLNSLNDTILTNKSVQIKDRENKGAIKITPYTPQEVPHNLHLLHKKIIERWGSLSLMDILTETDLRLGFSKKLKSVLSSERLSISDLTIRKLLCIYGLGTNMGISRMAFGEFYDMASELSYVKLRYIRADCVKEAIKDVVNGVIEIRDKKIWGVGLVGCACDSTKISVWDQNLLSEWHLRYGGKGVMVYWHVDKKALIVYSQLKTCTSSEVGSMLKGILEHDTAMEMNEIYTDTHGQSAVGFAFSHLLGFDLLPRIKNINKQKLYKASKDDTYSNIDDAVAKTPIKWTTIKEHYEQFVQCAAALKTGCVDPSVLLKRLSTANKDDPLYKAFLELGKVIRTIFLCQYIEKESLRIDIHESLNVVERVNGVMDFIFYGKLGELSTNNPENQELSILCLHLLQTCMVYINTLMIQEILNSENLNFTAQDFRALSPLIHGHLTPYGYFTIDLTKRIPFKHPANENAYDNTYTRSRKSQAIRQIAS